MNKQIKKLTYSAMLVCMGLLLPFLTASNPELGNVFCLMHIPVLLCGFICGWQWGLAVGVTVPLLRHLIIGAPYMPTAAFMAVELGIYGLISGLMYKLLPKKNGYLYISLIISMLFGRGVNAAVQFVFFAGKTGGFGLSAFLTSNFVTALPGIAIQLVIIPLIVMAIKRTKLFLNN